MPDFGNLGRRFSMGGNRRFGAGQQVKALPPKQTMRLDTFTLGMNMTDDPEGISQQSMALALDVEINPQGRIVKAPGTTYLGTFGTEYEPKQMLSATTPYNTQKAIFFDRAGHVGHKHGVSPTVWYDLGVDPSYYNRRYTGATYGDYFVFSNGSQVWSFDFSGNLWNEPTIPGFNSATIMEGRLYLAKGNGIYWSGTAGFFPWEDFSSITSGSEPLFANESVRTDIVALRSMEFDFMAILGQEDIWVGVPTGDPTRPLDFQPRARGGCVAEATAVVTSKGVMYLSTDGVRLFNGQTSEIVSQAINADILPLNLDQTADAGVRQYYSSYNPAAKRYYLHTGSATYVFDIELGRWFKRSLFCYGGIQLYAADGQTVSKFVFLGLNGVNTNLEYEDYDSNLYFGQPFVPRYEGPTSITPTSKGLKMVSSVKITYSGYGTVQLYLHDQERQYTEAGPAIPLTLSTPLREEQITFTHVGELLGLRLDILNGKLEIAAIEMDWIPRGPNFSGQIRTAHFERAADGSFYITDVPGPAYGWWLDQSVTPNEIVFDDGLVGPEFAVVGYDTDGSPFIEV